MTHSAHCPLPVRTATVWTGRYHESLSLARCTCGWSVPSENESVAELTAAEHARVRNTAAELAHR
jgi:hypothetical protein